MCLQFAFKIHCITINVQGRGETAISKYLMSGISYLCSEIQITELEICKSEKKEVDKNRDFPKTDIVIKSKGSQPWLLIRINHEASKNVEPSPRF